MNEVFKNVSPIAWFNISLLALLLIILPNFSPFFEIPYTAKRFFQVGFVCILLLQVILYRKVLERVIQQFLQFTIWTKWDIGSVLGLGIISALLANHSFYAFMEISMFVLLFVFLLFVIHFYKQAPKIFLVAVGGMLSVMVLVYFTRFSITYINTFLYPSWPVWPNTKLVQILVDGEPFYPEPFLGFVHARFLNHLHTWTLPLFALFFVSTPKKFWTVRGMLFFITSFWWMLVFAADARGTMLASILSLILVLFLFRKKIKDWVKVYLSTFITGLFAYFFFFKMIIPQGSRTILSRYTDSGRLEMWQHALDLFFQNPILGAGPMHYADFSNGFTFAHPHNFYLQILSEWGIVVFILLASIFVFGFMKWFRFCRKDIDSISSDKLQIKAALTASLAAGAMHTFISGVMHTPLSQLLMVIVLGWAIGFYQSEIKENFEEKSKLVLNGLKLWGIRITATGLLVFVLWGTIFSLQNLEKSRKAYSEKTGKTHFYPRFWDHGIIGVEKNRFPDVNKEN